MAGLWNRIRDRGENDDPISSHLVKAAIYLVVRGVFTAQQVRDALNAKLRIPLTTEELTDFNQIITNAALGSATAKLDYLERVDALNIAAEVGVMTNEATWRSELGLP